MTKLLVIRHGQSEANLQGLFAGHWDTPLTQLGKTQAEITGAYIAKNYTVDVVYTSDLQRAAAVGQAVSIATGAPITATESLREIRAGEWETVSFEELNKNWPSFQVWLKDIGIAGCDGGETVAQLQERVVAAVSKIAEDHPEQTVVLTTHATAIRALQCYCEGKTLAQMKDIPWVANTSITELTYEKGAFSVVRVNGTEHLGNAASTLPANV